jgi:hypothetical protein
MRGPARRDFLSVSARTGAAVAFAGLPPGLRQVALAATSKRSYPAGTYAVVLNGAPIGPITAFTETENAAALMTLVAPPRAGAALPVACSFSFSCGFAMSPAFYQWLQQSVARANPVGTVTFLSCDFNFKVQERIDFTSSRITQVQYSAVDSASKAECTALVVGQASSCHWQKGDGSDARGSMPAKGARRWLASFFRLSSPQYPDLAYTRSVSAISLDTSSAGGSFTFLISPSHANQIFPIRATVPNVMPAPTRAPNSVSNLATTTASARAPLQLAYLTPTNQTAFTLTFLQATFAGRNDVATAAGPLAQITVAFADARLDIGSAAS